MRRTWIGIVWYISSRRTCHATSLFWVVSISRKSQLALVAQLFTPMLYLTFPLLFLQDRSQTLLHWPWRSVRVMFYVANISSLFNQFWKLILWIAEEHVIIIARVSQNMSDNYCELPGTVLLSKTERQYRPHVGILSRLAILLFEHTSMKEL